MTRRGLVAIACVTAALVALTGSASALVLAGRSHPGGEVAAEACEPMVRDAVVAAVGAPLAGPPASAWHGRQYSCRYDVGDGSLTLYVDVQHDVAAAKAAFARARRAAAQPEQLNGLGQEAFQSTVDGHFVARKGRFLLRIDPGALPARLVRGDVAFAAAVAVMSCWTGEDEGR
jgi:hypothetical protein